MSKLVYYKFKSELNQHKIPFEGSCISFKELTEAIRKKHYNSQYDLVLSIKDIISKEERVCSENELIPAFSNVIVRRLPLSDQSKLNQNKKTINPENFTKVDPYKSMNEKVALNLFKKINFDSSSMTEEQKVDTVIESAAINYRFVGKKAPTGKPPSSYTCNKCNIPGHWINNCPGIPDKNGKLIDSRQVKRPSGIPVCGLVEVDENTPNSYLTPDGRYVVNIKNREALLKGKKDKRPFSIEENPPLVENPKNEIPKHMECKLCSNLITAPTKTGCCGNTFCRICITDYLFDPEKSTRMHQCPNCLGKIDKLDDLIEDSQLENLIDNWKINKISKNEIMKPINIIKSEEKIDKEITDDDLLNEIFSMDNKENDQPVNKKSEIDSMRPIISNNPATDELSFDIATAEAIRKLASEGCAQGIVELMKSNPKAIQMIQGIVNSLKPEHNNNNTSNRYSPRSRSRLRNHHKNESDHYHSSRYHEQSRNGYQKYPRPVVIRKSQRSIDDRKSHRSSRRHRDDDDKYYPNHRNIRQKRDSRNSHSKYSSESSKSDYWENNHQNDEYQRMDNGEQSHYKNKEFDHIKRNSHSSGKRREFRSRSPMKKIPKLSEMKTGRESSEPIDSDRKSKKTHDKSHKKHKKSKK